MVAISLHGALAARGEELPVQRAVHADRPLNTRSFRNQNRISDKTVNDIRRAVFTQEELPSPRVNKPGIDDPFAEGLVTPVPTEAPGLDIEIDEFDLLDTEDSGHGWGPHNCWVRAEALFWWTEGFYIPPLVTTSPAGTPRDVAGQLDQATTTVLLGNEDFVDSVRPGGRIRAGFWLDDCNVHGIEGSFLALDDRHETFTATSDANGNPILARPFLNVEPGFEGPDAELVSFPGFLRGSITVDGETTFQAYDVLYRKAVIRDCDRELDFLIGFRSGVLHDDLTISDTKTAIGAGGAIAIGTTIEEFDLFRTRNTFYGGEIGLIHRKFCCEWTFEALVKVALGSTDSRYIINGQTTVTVPGAAPVVTTGGLLTQGTNIGEYSNSEFSVIPEFGFLAAYQVSPTCHITAGYTFMYWTNVARAGEAIDTNLNLSQIPPGPLVGPANPAFAQNNTDVWIQGVNVGLEVQF